MSFSFVGGCVLFTTLVPHMYKQVCDVQKAVKLIATHSFVTYILSPQI